ncbi:hypothetical protein [Brevibacterium sp.]|nr:hypothetical protein [Brevibacterium sp.]
MNGHVEEDISCTDIELPTKLKDGFIGTYSSCSAWLGGFAQYIIQH